MAAQYPMRPDPPYLFSAKTIVEDAGGGVTYIGRTVPGNTTSDTAWQIQRITVSGGTTTFEFAAGTAHFDKAWASRASLSYS